MLLKKRGFLVFFSVLLNQFSSYRGKKSFVNIGRKKMREQEQKAEGKMMICTAQRAKADLILINNAISIIYLISLFLARCLTCFDLYFHTY